MLPDGDCPICNHGSQSNHVTRYIYIEMHILSTNTTSDVYSYEGVKFHLEMF